MQILGEHLPLQGQAYPRPSVPDLRLDLVDGGDVVHEAHHGRVEGRRLLQRVHDDLDGAGVVREEKRLGAD